MLTKSLDVIRYVKASAGRSNLNVVFEDVNRPRHDGKTIYLPKITFKTTDEELLHMMASTDHEVSHDHNSDFGILQEKKIDPSKSKLGFLWNLLEDSRVNVLEAVDYEGFREIWDQSCSLMFEDIKGNIKENTPENVIIRSLIKWEGNVSRRMFPVTAVVASSFPTEKVVDDILAPFAERLEKCQKIKAKKPGSAATYKLARDIFKALGGDPDEEERRAKEEAEKEGKEGKAGGKPGEGSADKLDGREKKGVKPEKIIGEWDIQDVDLSDLDKKLATVHTMDHSKMSTVGLRHDSVPDLHNPWSMTPIEQFIIVDFANGYSSNRDFDSMLTDTSSSSWFRDSFDSRVRGKANASEDFAQQVRRLIQIRSRVRYEYGVKKGKLDQARLARIVTKQPGFSERVFKNKITNTTLNAAVTILLDMSGSMSGDKALFSAEATILLNNVFKVLKVPLEILGFTDRRDKPVGYIYKPFSVQRLPDDTLLTYIGRSSGAMSGNPDGDCIIWAYDRLLHRKEKKRLLLVMSDGQPAAYRGESGVEAFTLQAIQEIEQGKKVDIYGLGLCDISVKKYYKAHSTVNRPEEIPIRLLELIEQKLLS